MRARTKEINQTALSLPMVSIHLCGGASVKLYLGYSQCIRNQGIRVLNKSPTCTLKKDLHPHYNVLRFDFFQDHLGGGRLYKGK